jgi:uncharacterized cupin superfamily protein
MKRFNYLQPDYQVDPDDPPGYQTEWCSIHSPIGSERIGGNVMRVQPGDAATPYHWERPSEEWLFVLDGSPTVRTPEGEEVLQTGDIVCFPGGPAGAHQVLNRSDEPVTFIMLSDRAPVNAIVYPDSNKIAFGSPHEHGRYRLSDNVDYWAGEGG